MSAPFRFDEATHTYYLDGQRVPSITQMLEQAGHVDTTWFTPEARDRGTAVHHLCQEFDLGALDPHHTDSPFRGWLLGYVAAMRIIRPEWDQIEEGAVHPVHRFAGKPDRVGRVFGLQSVMEIKSGAIENSHGIQTALQAILKSDDVSLPPMAIQRLAVYVDGRAKFRVEQHKDRRDFDEAYRVIRRCCR